MGRVLAVDFGIKRVGLAVSDPLRLTVRGLGTHSPDGAVIEIVEFHSSDPVEIIVIGKPNRSTTEFDRAMKRFEDALRLKLGDVQCVYTNEDNSSIMALELRRKHFKQSKQRNKELIDELSAIVILREYLGLEM